jgi:hypothetical protein
MTASDLFADLREMSLDDVRERYNTLLETIQRLETERKEMYVVKKLRSDVIRYAVNKLTTAPTIQNIAQKDLLEQAVAEKQVFDELLSQRDALNNRMGVPRYRLVDTLQEFHRRLTQNTHYSESPSLASEMDMFSRFFEIQAMIEIYNAHRSLLTDIDHARGQLLETVKAINREDRKFAQQLTANNSETRPLRREAGRLRAFLEKKSKQEPKPLPEEIEEFSLRLMAGDSLSMEEFSSMLSHGGLTELEERGSPASSPQKRKKKTQRRVDPMPGRKRTSTKK